MKSVEVDALVLARGIYESTRIGSRFALEWDRLNPKFREKRIRLAQCYLNLVVAIKAQRNTAISIKDEYDAGAVIDMNNIACGFSPYVRRNAESK